MAQILKLPKRLFALLCRQYIAQRNPYVRPDANRLKAYRCYGDMIAEVFPCGSSELTLLSDGFVQKPGHVKIDGSVYDLTKDGLYRFYRTDDFSMQRLVCSDGILSALNSVGYSYKYGNVDDGLRRKQRLLQLSSRTLVLSCYALSATVRDVFKELGFSARVVAVVSMEAWGGHDDGHTLLEIKINGRWAAYDPSFNMLFKQRNEYLSVVKLTETTDLSCVTFEPLPGHKSPGGFKVKDYDYSLWVEERFLSNDALLRWYERMFEVPLMLEDGGYYFPESRVKPDDMPRATWQYNAMEDGQFMKKFYNGGDHA